MRGRERLRFVLEHRAEVHAHERDVLEHDAIGLDGRNVAAREAGRRCKR